MNLQNLIGGMSAAQYAGQQSAEEARTAERQVRELERMRAQDALSVRNEQYRQGLMQPVEGPAALPGGAPVGLATPTMVGAPSAPAAPAAPAPRPPAGPSPFLSPTAPNQSTAESARLARAGRPPAIMTPEQAQVMLDRAALMKAPAAALDIASLPISAGVNALGTLVAGGQNLVNRGINAVTGEQTMRTDKAYPKTSYTSFYDALVRTPEEAVRLGTMTEAQRLAELQRLNTQAQPAATAPQAAPAAPAANVPRGIRNNNPGNIIASPFATRMGATGVDDKGFAIFPDAASGERAAVSLLGVYGQQGLNTVEQIVSKWSPPNAPGNTPQATQNYINFVSQQLGVAPGVPLNMQDPQVLQRIAAAKFKFENGPGPLGQGAAQPAMAATPTAPAQAAAPAAAPAPTMQFTPEQITRISTQAQQELRMADMRLQELNRLLPLAPDVATASKIREQANQIRFTSFAVQLTDAAAQAMGGNQNALAQLATAARVQYAQTPQGFVEVALDPATNQYKAVSQPMPLNSFINSLYSVATGAAAKAEAQRREAALKVQGEIAVEQVKGLNKLREVSATAERDLQKALFERQLSANDVAKIDTVGGLGKEQVVVTMKNGQMAILQPAQDLGGGMMSQPRLQPIQ